MRKGRIWCGWARRRVGLRWCIRNCGLYEAAVCPRVRR